MSLIQPDNTENVWPLIGVVVGLAVLFFFLFWWLATTEIRDEVKEIRRDLRKLLDVLKKEPPDKDS